MQFCCVCLMVLVSCLTSNVYLDCVDMGDLGVGRTLPAYPLSRVSMVLAGHWEMHTQYTWTWRSDTSSLNVIWY